MNILMTHLHLTYIHGSEIWTHTIIKELNNRGYNIYIWSPEYSRSFRNCFNSDLNCTIINSKQMIDNISFDMILLQHATPLSNHGFWKDYLYTRLDPLKTINICHSRFGTDEYPLITPYLIGSKYVCISNEIRDNININWDGILRQPIYDSWFDLKLQLNDFPKRILYANHRHEMPPSLREYCKVNDIILNQIGKHDLCPYKIQKEYQECDLVIGTGRWIYESLSAGIPCIIGDRDHVLDYVNSENIDEFEYYNMTLRNPNKNIPNWDILLTQYDSKNTCKDLAKSRYSVSTIVDKLLYIWNK